MKLKQKYKELKSKYNLPDYDSLNHDFDIEEINDESELILTKIRIKMYEKIDFYKEIIEDLVQPDTSLNSMFEAKNFTDKEREVAYLLFKKLMQLLRQSNLVALNNHQKQTAEYINETYKTYNSLKPDIEKHLTKLTTVWEHDKNAKSELNYFG
jgi:hypothetical protein